MIVQVVLLHGHAELSEYVRMAQHLAFEDLRLGIRVLDADLRDFFLLLYLKKILRVAAHVLDLALSLLVLLLSLFLLGLGSDLL